MPGKRSACGRPGWLNAYKYATMEALQRRATFAAKHTLEMEFKALESWYDKFVVGMRAKAVV